jgi:hypothetical protein
MDKPSPKEKPSLRSEHGKFGDLSDFNAGDETCRMCGMRIVTAGGRPNVCHFCEMEEFDSP